MENLKKIEEIEHPKPVFDLKPIRHGLRARAIMLKGENLRDFDQLCNTLELEWNPRTPTEQFYLERPMQCQFRLERSFARAQRDLQRLQKTRPHPPQAHRPPPNTHRPRSPQQC
jgi:hypothetical protein